MTYEEMRTWLRQRPFQPFRVHVSDGRSFDIPWTGMTLLLPTYVKIGIPIDEGPSPVCDHTEYVPLKQIERVEPLTGPQSAVGSSGPGPCDRTT